jgi:hypothetical protein
MTILGFGQVQRSSEAKQIQQSYLGKNKGINSKVNYSLSLSYVKFITSIDKFAT